jgi:hypothetical protein
MIAADDSDAKSDVLQSTWVVLDEARQVLLRAESIIVLLGVESDASPHHAYAADVAGDLLGALKEKLSQAQEMVRPTRRPCSPTTVRSGG